MLRENQRSLNRAIRDLDREKAKLDQQEKKIVNDIKAMAKDGQNVSLTFFFSITSHLPISGYPNSSQS